MKKEYIDFYLSITDLKKMVPDFWYTYPVTPIKQEFIDWYFKETMAIEFSNNKTHFKVNFYPTEAEKTRVLSSVGYDPSIIKNKKEKIIHIDDRALKSDSKKIPGTCSRPDIVANIMKKEYDEVAERNRKHQQEMEFLKRKKEFMEGSKPDPFSQF